MEAIAKGILSGLGYGLLIGPLFFLNIRVTLTQGLRHGIALVAGAFTSDCLLVLACWIAATKLEAITTDRTFQSWFGLICGLLLFVFGAAAAFSRKRDFSKEMQADIPPAKRRYAYFQGMLINSTNPSNWLFWLSVATIAKSQASEGNARYAQIFMTAALIALFFTDITKVLLAHRIGRLLKPGVPEKIVKFAGFILIGLSLWIITQAVQNWQVPGSK